jgi:signal transduction histidine kinase
MTETVLYVDDDKANLVVLRATCADEFDVVTALGGNEALEILEQREVAVLLADQRMPGMTGVELFEQTQELYPDTVRILITAYSDLSDAISAINRGKIRRYIRKPWEPDELKAVLREGIEIFQTRRKIMELETRLIETERTYALGVVAASVAHELRNPLAAMVMGLDLAQLRLDNLKNDLRAGIGVEPNHVEALGRVRGQLDEVAAAADQISDITRGMELGHRRSDEDAYANLKDIVNLTLTFVRAALLKVSQLEVRMDPVPRVVGSPSKLGQVMTNLLVNAMQAMPARSRTDNLITVTMGRDETPGWVRLSVADNGEGISTELAERIFDPFFTTKTQGGTGLGLAISKKIVEEAGGTIEVVSEPGSGTTFTVRLKAAESG